MIFTAAISGIPEEIEDSAMIDGASRLQYVRYILLPLLKVPIVSLTAIQLPLIYNHFLEPYVYLDPSNSTLLARSSFESPTVSKASWILIRDSFRSIPFRSAIYSRL